MVLQRMPLIIGLHCRGWPGVKQPQQQHASKENQMHDDEDDVEDSVDDRDDDHDNDYS